MVLRRQVQRGVDWFVLLDGSSDEVRRLNPSAYEFVGRFDGRTPVSQIWNALLEADPERAMSQEEAVRLLSALHERQLIEFDQAPDIEAVFRGRDQIRSRRRWQMVNPLAFRMPLVDPSRWLGRLAALAEWLFSGRGLLAWLALLLAAVLAGAPHARELTAHAAQLLGTTHSLTAGWLLYPLIKLLHELAHGLAMVRWGLMPRQAGVSLLLLTPVPYVDASAADALRHRHQRAAISAAGIMAELALAALALLVWLVVQPGLVRDGALVVMLIGTLSTLLVNGNPLLRFDGYFVLCDLLDLRNLGTRSTRWWQGKLRAWLLADRLTPPMECQPGERRWLMAYAPLSLAYRLGLIVAVSLWVGSFSAVLGFVLAAVMLVSAVARPLWSALKAVRAQPGAAARLRVGAAVCAVALLLIWPLPHRSVTLGVVLPPEHSLVRAGTDGFLVSWQRADGDRVQTGDTAALLEDDALEARHAAQLAQATELDVQLYAANLQAPHEAAALREKLAFSQAEAARLGERLAARNVQVQAAGRLVLARQQDREGRWVRHGDVIGHVLNDEPMTLRVAVPHADAALLSHAAPAVQVRLASEAGQARTGHVTLHPGAAVMRLPSAALGTLGGGPVPTVADDREGLNTQEPVVLLEVVVPGLSGRHIGERAHVRFDLGRRSLADRGARELRQLLLRHFNPSA